MKKAMSVICALIMMLCVCTGYAGENSIKNVSTVVGSFSHDGFVPHHLVIFGGELVVSDKDNHRLSVVDMSTSKVVRTYGSYGSGEDELRFPRGLAVSGKELLVCDSYNDRIVFLNTAFEPAYILPLGKEPKDICLMDGILYILLADGVTIDCYDMNTKIYASSMTLSHSAEHIAGIGSTIIASGSGQVNALDVAGDSREVNEELGRAHAVNTFGESIYALYAGIVCVYDKDYNLTDKFRVNGGTFIYPCAEGVYVADEDKALVYFYKDGSIAATYGSERKWGEPTRISATGTTVAAKVGGQIYIYKDGRAKASVYEKDAVDVLLRDDRLYVLNGNSIVSYNIVSYNIENDGTGGMSLKQTGKLNANSTYRFTAMDEANGVIYICEAESGKVLKVGTDLKVFTTAVSRLTMPKSVAAAGDKLYVAEQGRISVYDTGGNFLSETAGDYSALSYDRELYAVNYGDKQIARFSNELSALEPIEHEGYFLGLADLEAQEYGLYVCDYSRKEIMAFTDESLNISQDNVTINGQEFNGTVVRGQTLQVQVSGAGMLNPLPGVGDVRYLPLSCGIDKEVAFKESDGVFAADISMPSVGNYTLKVKYQKQVYQSGGWRDEQSASGTVIKELSVTVTEGDTVSRNESSNALEEIFGAFKSIFGMNE